MQTSKTNVVKKTKDKIAEARRQFCITQIQNTKKIIKQLPNAILLNSLLSLVVLPYEDSTLKNGEKIFQGKMKDINLKLGFSPILFQPIRSCVDGEVKYSNGTIYAYINKLRNAIADQNIIIDVSEEEPLITFFNIYYMKGSCKKCPTLKCAEKGLKRQGRGVCDFKITVTLVQLKKLEMYIADSYLKAIGGK